MSFSRSSPRRAARRSSTSQARNSPSAAPLAPITGQNGASESSGGVSSVAASAAPAAPQRTNTSTTATAPKRRSRASRTPRPRARRTRTQLVAVEERRDEPAPDLVVPHEIARDAEVAEIERRVGHIGRTTTPRSGRRSRTASCRARSRRSPRHEAGAASWCACAASRRLARVAVDLRGALAHPLPAVGALGHVRAHLGAAVLADDEQVWLRHGSLAEYPAAERFRRLSPRPPQRAPARWRRGSLARPRGGGWPRRPPPVGWRRCAVEDLLEAVEVVHRAELLGVRRSRFISPRRSGTGTLLVGQVDEVGAQAVTLPATCSRRASRTGSASCSPLS